MFEYLTKKNKIIIFVGMTAVFVTFVVTLVLR